MLWRPDTSAFIARPSRASEISRPRISIASIQFFTGPMTIREILSSAILAHGIHHRGQLTLMCRLAGGQPPGLYGPEPGGDGGDASGRRRILVERMSEM